MPFARRHIPRVFTHFLLSQSKKSFSLNGHFHFKFVVWFQTILAPPLRDRVWSKNAFEKGTQQKFGYALGLFDFIVFQEAFPLGASHALGQETGGLTGMRRLPPNGLEPRPLVKEPHHHLVFPCLPLGPVTLLSSCGREDI